MSYKNDYVDSVHRQCKGKRGYGSKSKARAAGRRVASLGGIVKPVGRMQAYRCPHCGLFHLGHRRKKHEQHPV